MNMPHPLSEGLINVRPFHNTHKKHIKLKSLQSPMSKKDAALKGPLTLHQGKTVEGTCLGGYVVVRSLDLGEVSTCQNKKMVQVAGPEPTWLMFFSKDKWVLHLECNLLLRGCLEFPCITLPPRLPSFKSFPLHPSQLHSFNSHRPKAIAQQAPTLPKRVSGKHAARQLARSSTKVFNNNLDFEALTIVGWVDVADIDNDKVFDTKPTHSHPPHPTTKHPPFHPSSLSNSNPCLLPIPQHSPPLSFCTLCACHSATTTHHLIHNQRVWASASEPAGSVSTTQSQKREVGTIARWPHARAC